MSWLDRFKKSAPSPTPPAKRAENAPRGLRARIQEKTEEYKEPLGLLQQFAGAALGSEASLLCFSNLEYQKSRIEIRVPNQECAHTLCNIMNESLGVPQGKAGPLRRKECNTLMNGEPMYLVYMDISKNSPLQCTAALSAALRHINVEPDGLAHFTTIDHAAEADLRMRIYEEEKKDERPRGNPPAR